MKFGPYEYFTISSVLTVDDIVSILKNHVDENNDNPSAEYLGTINLTEFKIVRKIENPSSRNSFNPIMIINISKNHHGSILKVKMRLERFVQILLSIVAYGFIMIGIQTVQNQLATQLFDPESLGFFVVIIAIYATVTFMFKRESKKNKEFIISLINGKVLP